MSAPTETVNIPAKYQQYLERPDIYAVRSRGDCMSEISEGDVLLVDPHERPRSDDLVAIFFKGRDGGLVKRLIIHALDNGTNTVVGTSAYQTNPERSYSYRPEAVDRVHKVVAVIPAELAPE